MLEIVQAQSKSQAESWQVAEARLHARAQEAEAEAAAAAEHQRLAAEKLAAAQSRLVQPFSKLRRITLGAIPTCECGSLLAGTRPFALRQKKYIILTYKPAIPRLMAVTNIFQVGIQSCTCVFKNKPSQALQIGCDKAQCGAKFNP